MIFAPSDAPAPFPTTAGIAANAFGVPSSRITVRSGSTLEPSVTLRSAPSITPMHSSIGSSARTSWPDSSRVSGSFMRSTMPPGRRRWKSGAPRRIFGRRAPAARQSGGHVQLPIIAMNFVYAILGVVLMYVTYKLIDVLTPEVNFHEELKKGNVAVAIFLGAIFIAIGMIVG